MATKKIPLFIAALTGVLLGETIWLSCCRISYDIDVYWDAFRALSAGGDPYAVYGFHHLPLAGWLPWPFAVLGKPWWPLGWILLIELSVLGGLIMASRVAGWSLKEKSVICLNLFILASPPVFLLRKDAQQVGIVFFLVLLGLYLSRRRHWAIGGLCIGFGLALKPHLALLVLPLLAGWKAIAWTSIGLLAPHTISYHLLPSYIGKILAIREPYASLGRSQLSGSRYFILDLLPWGLSDHLRLIVLGILIFTYLLMLAWTWKRREATIMTITSTLGLLVLPFSIPGDWILLVPSYWILLSPNLIGLTDIWIRIALAMIWVNAVFVGFNNAYALLPMSVTPLVPLALLVASIARRRREKQKAVEG